MADDDRPLDDAPGASDETSVDASAANARLLITSGEPLALERLARLTPQRSGPPPRMGYQPGLDGIRAVSVVIVILYHAGFEWMHGGFFGVEVFFVVSGFLITSLLLDERETTGGTALGQFWLRRARRLLPALFTMLLAVSIWAAFFGEQHLYRLGRDMPWAVFYLSNWAQALGNVPYFAATDPPLLRHLWSLAVEEQWYIVWPLVVVAILRAGRPSTRVPVLLLVASATSMALAAWLSFSDGETLSVLWWDPSPQNFVYLSTFTRASGLVLGAAFAFFWRPWRWQRAAQMERTGLDVAGFVAMAAIVVIAASRAESVIGDGTSLWRIWMPLVTVLSMVAVAVVVHPGARRMRAVFGWGPLVEVGKRSYGLYLWHWPIFVFTDVRPDGHTDVVRFLQASAVTIVVSELCYRFVETPIRTGGLGRAWAALAGGPGARRVILATFTGAALLFLSVSLGLSMGQAEESDLARDDSVVEFDFDASAPVATASTAPVATEAPTDSAPAVTDVPVTEAPTTTLASLPRSVVIVGDSQAHSLAVNLPEGIEGTFTISDGSVEGCGVLSDGSVRSARTSFSRSFADCAGFADEWGAAAAANSAELALVVIGAWDVFDVEVDGVLVPFASAEADQRFLDGLQAGIDAVRAAGTHVALLEVACMRPQDVEGAGVPALPERGDDARVAHVNDLLRQAVEANPGGDVSFVSGPTEWCNDETISTDLYHRWDGVHVYKPGANLIYTTIAPTLLQIPL